MIYNADSIHDNSVTCACQKCIEEKGKTFTTSVSKESFPWSENKEQQVSNITYELKQFADGFCYVDKNMKIW